MPLTWEGARKISVHKKNFCLTRSLQIRILILSRDIPLLSLNELCKKLQKLQFHHLCKQAVTKVLLAYSFSIGQNLNLLINFFWLEPVDTFGLKFDFSLHQRNILPRHILQRKSKRSTFWSLSVADVEESM